MGMLHDLMGWFGSWGKRSNVPVDDDLQVLEGLDGCETAYLSLAERHALDRLIDSGHARRETMFVIGTQVFSRVKLMPNGREG